MEVLLCIFGTRVAFASDCIQHKFSQNMRLMILQGTLVSLAPSTRLKWLQPITPHWWTNDQTSIRKETRTD